MDAGLDIGNSQSQVIPIMVRDDQAIFGLAEELVHAGVFLQPIRFPAVTKHQSRFRISVSAAHSTEELERGAEIISNVLGGKTR